MRCLITAACLAGLTLPAQASPELALDFGNEAAMLYTETAHALAGAPLPERFEDDLVQFSVTAGRLAAWVDRSGRPSDLGCIFRGMSEEAAGQLDAMTQSGARAASLRRLAALFHDAQMISLAARYAKPSETQGQADTALASCPADPSLTRQYLTVQP